MDTAITKWTGGMAFESEIKGHKINIDAAENVGGSNSAPPPKILLLSSLTGCTGMDVVSLLAKMRVPFEKYWMEAEAQLSEEHPKVYTHIHLKYFFEGDQLNKNKIEKSILLSQERYCGVTAMLKKNCPIDFSLYLNGKQVEMAETLAEL